MVIGSQAIPGQFADPPAELLVSVEADVLSLRNAEDADLIDGSIGEASPFHQAFGYYAHGVGERTAVLPEDWRLRLIPLAGQATGGATGFAWRFMTWPRPSLLPAARRIYDTWPDYSDIILQILKLFGAACLKRRWMIGSESIAMRAFGKQWRHRRNKQYALTYRCFGPKSHSTTVPMESSPMM